MKLKRVEIKGFKSLAKKTVLSLTGDVTCIAGPNGCGKSNVIDAIRWALGEQSARSLRANAMSDIIFSGTQNVPQGGMSRVTLEFMKDGGYFPKSLDGFEEVSISRRLFRTGESIYTINDVRCRLKDIADIFLDTGLDRYGYAIIEQGKIKDIIQSKPEDIRYLIEEAAGVGKFRVKRAETIKRLEATSNNLERIQDVLEEVTRQRNTLRTQARKAKQYQVLRAEINDQTRMLWGHELHTIKALKDEFDDKLRDLQSRIESLTQTTHAHNSRIRDLVTRLEEIKGRREATQKALSEARSRLEIARSDIEARKSRLDDIESTVQMLSGRISQTRDSAQETVNKINTEKQAIKGLTSEIAGLETQVALKHNHLHSIRKERDELEQEYQHKRAELFDSIGHAKAIEQRLSSMYKRHHEIEVNISQRQKELRDLEQSKQGLQLELNNLDEQSHAKRSTLHELHLRIEKRSREKEDLQVFIDSESQKMFGLEKSQAEITTKMTMLDRIINQNNPLPKSNARGNNGYRKVADTIAVKPGYEETIGKAMGTLLDYGIINKYEEVIDSSGIDNSSPGYIPAQPYLENVQAGKNLQGEGVIGPLREGVDALDGFEHIRDVLTMNMWVVEDIQHALKLWEKGNRFCSLVTKDGMILEPTGIIRTSFEMSKYVEILQSKAEKTELAEKQQKIEDRKLALSEALAQAKKLFDRMQEELHVDEDGLDVLKQAVEQVQARRDAVSRELERGEERTKSFMHNIEMWQEMCGKFEEDIQGLAQEKAALEEKIVRFQEEVRSVDEKLKSAKMHIDRAAEDISDENTKLNAMRVEQASKQERARGLEEETGRCQQEIEHDSKRIEELTHTKSEIEKSIAEIKSALGKDQFETERLDAVYEELLPQYTRANDEVMEVQKTLEEKQEILASLEKEKNEALLKHKEQDIAYSMSYERLESRFGKDIPDILDSFDPAIAREKAARLQTKIERMGHINFTSIEAYDNVQARWDDLHRQYEDLVQASARLRQVISSIERESTKEFMTTFTQVRANFQEIFITIFGGGTADIVLQDSTPLDAGVDIYASPPHKRLKAMSLLSEGEKTLCALAFIFALFKVRPSPICILDEVDAPLDDANVDRFNRLIRSFSKESQFIVVTHNRQTLEMADVIYGVTYDVPGISKVVSMDLHKESG
ncbi:MAG: chromosome segregation protein SMC [Deltaproteobacteria bacterium]|nr:chromosome segregation protein SMC [Deltaproteobacteria bacterium]